MALSAELREEREWGEGANGQQGKAPERVRGFICRGELGLQCSRHGNDWAPWAVL
jgi:hypothetical protein